MSKHKDKLEKFIDLYKEREYVYDQINFDMYDMIEDTVLYAFEELFELDQKSVRWYDINLTQTTLHLVASLLLDADNKLSEFLIKLFELSGMDYQNIDDTERVINLNLPLSLIFEDKDDIKKFMMDAVNDPALNSISEKDWIGNEVSENGLLSSDQFDSTNLTPEQITQMLILQQQTKGIKH